MTPVYDLSQSASPFPFVDLNEDQHLQHFTDLAPHQAAAAPYSSSYDQDYYSFGTQDQREKHYSSPESHQAQHKVNTYDLEGGSSDHHALSSSSTSRVTNNSRNDDGSVRWMATKVRLQIRKIVNSSTNDHHHRGKSTRLVREKSEEFISTSCDIVRVCSDCNTTKTPLWRSGPQGPKTLCNACGIRQRKARRALAAAAEAEAARTYGTDMGATSSTTYNKVHKKEKKSRVDTQKRKLQENNNLVNNTSPDQDDGINKRINKFEEFAIRLSKNSAFPRDEEEAAILLMALSCGLVHG